MEPVAAGSVSTELFLNTSDADPAAAQTSANPVLGRTAASLLKHAAFSLCATLACVLR